MSRSSRLGGLKSRRRPPGPPDAADRRVESGLVRPPTDCLRRTVPRSVASAARRHGSQPRVLCGDRRNVPLEGRKLVRLKGSTKAAGRAMRSSPTPARLESSTCLRAAAPGIAEARERPGHLPQAGRRSFAAALARTFGPGERPPQRPTQRPARAANRHPVRPAAYRESARGFGESIRGSVRCRAARVPVGGRATPSNVLKIGLEIFAALRRRRRVPASQERRFRK